MLEKLNLNLTINIKTVFLFLSFLALLQTGCNNTYQVEAKNNNIKPKQLSFKSSINPARDRISKAESINQVIGFLKPDQVLRVQNYNILGNNIYSSTSVFNVAYYWPSSGIQRSQIVRQNILDNLFTIYEQTLKTYNLVLLRDGKEDSIGRQVWQIRGTNCLASLVEDTCLVRVLVDKFKLDINPPFVYRKGGSYFAKLNARLDLPEGIINPTEFYTKIAEKLPNWTYYLVDFKANQTVHIATSDRKYYF